MAMDWMLDQTVDKEVKLISKKFKGGNKGPGKGKGSVGMMMMMTVFGKCIPTLSHRVNDSLTDCHFRIWTQRVTFER